MSVPPGRRRSRGRPRGARAQTGFDFLVGMSVFLLTVGFTLTFVPGMFQPFDTDTGQNLVTADRGAASLAESLLVDGARTPGVLDETCTAEFFDGDGNTASCRFDRDSSDLNSALGLDAARTVNVTIASGGSVVSIGGEDAEAGPATAPTADIVVSKRVVLVGDEEATLFVRVW